MIHKIFAILAIVVLLTSMSVAAEGSDNRMIRINLLLKTQITDNILAELGSYGTVWGVIIVASAGNEGNAGMGYPAAYAPVISVAASGWTGEWLPLGNAGWWWNLDVADPTNPANFYIVPWSSRELAGQDLDVAAPGTWIVGPYQYQMGKISYSFNSGTSLSSPQVAGIVALMAQKYPLLTAPQAEGILSNSAEVVNIRHCHEICVLG